MKRVLGVAYCGLACCICGENENCLGCRNDGCKDKEWCKNFKCCKEKGLKGCWECSEYPCTGGMLDKIRIRAFATFIKQYGEEELMQCLERNKKSGIIYHYEGELVGDYDKPQTEAEIINMIMHGYEPINKNCIACGMPMKESADYAMGDMKKDYCIHCARPDGTMQSFEEKLSSLTAFIIKTQGLDESMALDAARVMMSRLPAWT